MPESKPLLQLTLSGKGITPSTLSSSKLGELISSYESALQHLIERDYKSIDIKEVFISLVDIQKGSANLAFVPSVDQVFLAAQTVNQKIIDKKFQDLPFGTVESLHKIWAFTKQNNCIAILNGQPDLPKAQISPEVEISIDESFYYSGETVIYGKLVRVGGALPKIRIQTEDGQTFSIEVREGQAKRLATKLYEVVGLRGTAKWRKDNFAIESFSFIELMPFNEQPITQSIEELKKIIGESWSNIQDPLGYIINQRYSE